MYYIYNFLATVLFIFVILPYFTWRYFREKGFPRRFRQSMGFIRDEEIAAVAHKNCIWIHGASVGEIVATSPLVKEIRKAMPDAKILVSAVTTGGYNMAHQIIPEADAIIYFPLDLPFVSESFVKRIMPRIFMPVETELWPNFLRAIKLRRIPVMMVNGRISDKSVKSYRYLFGILADMMGSVTRFCMQSSIDAEYIQHLGAEKRRIFVTGNTKFDQTYAEVTPEDLHQYKEELGLEDDYPVIVAGSTHPTEEDTLFQSFLDIRKEFPRARLIVAPRKPGRIHEISRLAEKYGLTLGLRSVLKEMDGPRPRYSVVLIDTIGELGRIYAVGDAVFVGGSLIDHGGHNVLEPAAHAKPIIVGPSMSNFKDSFALLSKVGACVQIRDGQEMTALGEEQLRKARQNIGMIFQHFNLLMQKSVLDNVCFPMQIAKKKKDEAKKRALELLETVGLADKADAYPAQLSGGEQQRVSIARALAKNPKLLLCDEPTGALDYNTGKAILKLLQDMCRERGMTVILITHNSAITPMADRVIKMKNGKVGSMKLNERPVPVETIEW